jgi:multiple sugar transport system ATP-binding protein
VTHDQVEAMTMGDRVAVLRDGRLEQVDAPQALYDRPASLFVAGFIGSPAMNLLRGRLLGAGTHAILQLGSSQIELPETLLAATPSLVQYLDRELVVGIRPEALSAAADPAAPHIVGPVALVEALGSDVLAHVDLDAPAVLAGDLLEVAEELQGPDGDGALPETARLTARLDPATRPRLGERLGLCLDLDRLHFFDPQSERAIR